MRKTEGLTVDEVEMSRRQHGSNRLTQVKRRSFADRLWESFGDPIIKILLIALAINVLLLFRRCDWYEPVGIAVAVCLATVVSTVSEYGSESAFARLQEEARHVRCRVRRAGQTEEIAADEVVVGDRLLLQAGERVPADGEVTEGRLTVDQSALNGESREAVKQADGSGGEDDLAAAGRVFRGSVVCGGEAVVRVTRVGDATLYGRLAREVQEETRESPLKVRLAGLAQTISRWGYAAAVLVGVADLIHGCMTHVAMLSQPTVLGAVLMHALTLAITVVVVAVPEGLPMMITVVLSSNMRRMLKDQVLVRKLVGIETSGSLNLLFTDKTGTLTRGRLQVSRMIDGAGRAYDDAMTLRRQHALWDLTLLSCAGNTESAWSGGHAVGGNATDRALLTYALSETGGAAVPAGVTVAERVPFDSARKYAAVRLTGAREMWLIKGAPEILLPRCVRYVGSDGTVLPLTAERVRHRWKEMTGQAMRVLVLAMADGRESDRFQTADTLPALTLIGLVGLRDEVRPEAAGAIRQLHRAGIQVVMVTGDNRDTAVAIARQAGWEIGADTVLTSGELAALSDDEVKRRLPTLRVVARALPSDKSRLVRLAQETGRVVGMTGDGINDAPALKKADVGFAMGSGTEVAKEAGDIVILDDNMASIARAVLYGRTIFKSIRKFIVFQLTMNLCAVGVSVIGPFIGIDTPVTVMQMLWINMIMDTLAGLAFAGEPPLPEYMDEPPKRRDEPILNRDMAWQIGCRGAFTVALCVWFLCSSAVRLWFRYALSPAYFMTAFFALFIFAGVFNSVNARTTRLNVLAHLRKNPSFVGFMALVVGVQLLLIYYGGTLFRTAGLTVRELRMVVALALSVIPADWLRKLWLRWQGRKERL